MVVTGFFVLCGLHSAMHAVQQQEQEIVQKEWQMITKVNFLVFCHIFCTKFSMSYLSLHVLLAIESMACVDVITHTLLV